MVVNLPNASKQLKKVIVSPLRRYFVSYLFFLLILKLFSIQGLTSMMNAFSLAAFTTSLELNPFDEDYKVIINTLANCTC